MVLHVCWDVHSIWCSYRNISTIHRSVIGHLHMTCRTGAHTDGSHTYVHTRGVAFAQHATPRAVLLPTHHSVRRANKYAYVIASVSRISFLQILYCTNIKQCKSSFICIYCRRGTIRGTRFSAMKFSPVSSTISVHVQVLINYRMCSRATRSTSSTVTRTSELNWTEVKRGVVVVLYPVLSCPSDRDLQLIVLRTRPHRVPLQPEEHCIPRQRLESPGML